MDIFEKLSLAGLVPVIKVEDANDAVPLCRALSEGGLPVAEITFRTAAAEQAIRKQPVKDDHAGQGRYEQQPDEEPVPWPGADLRQGGGPE